MRTYYNHFILGKVILAVLMLSALILHSFCSVVEQNSWSAARKPSNRMETPVIEGKAHVWLIDLMMALFYWTIFSKVEWDSEPTWKILGPWNSSATLTSAILTVLCFNLRCHPWQRCTRFLLYIKDLKGGGKKI